jgi:hypothetical protein
MTSPDKRCCGSGVCIIDGAGQCWCGQVWDGEKMSAPSLTIPSSINSTPEPEVKKIES